ncbi:MAG: rRNA pseudouridine synthase [Corallococcus sp.]|nr:rRNA pseudouridine synthase [Corallococcus sp.]
MRLNKYLADCGVASRRACDKLIADGKVKVNGNTVTEMGVSIEPEKDKVTVNEKRVALKKKNYYILLHKPKGYVTTVSDDLGRKTVMDLIDIKTRLYPVGRLDYDTEGAIILTNDGNLANKLTHPKHNVDKTYIARISGKLSANDIRVLQEGIVLDDKKTAPAKVDVLTFDEHYSRVRIVIHEGRNRQVKRMFEYIGKDVKFLKRISIGDIYLGGLGRGKYRFLSDKEIEYLSNL